MRFRIFDVNKNDVSIPKLKNKEVHMVGFAEVGMSAFRSLLQFSFDYKLDDAYRVCENINKADEAGTIYPQGYMTGLPVRFFRSPLNEENIDKFRSCLRDAFVINRDYCKSQEMVFHYAFGISNRDEIIDETIQMANGINDDSALKLITIVADSRQANTFLQLAAFGRSSFR